jgi:hypothetical protein
MANLDHEAQLFSLFKKSCQIETAPYAIRDYCYNLNHEKVVCIHRSDIPRILSVRKGVTPNSILATLYGKERGEIEYYGVYVQLVATLCIHTNAQVIMLELAKDCPTTNYLKGTYTYPQGHCQYSVIANTVSSPQTRVNLPFIYDCVRKEGLREALEEITIEDPVMLRQLSTDLQDRIANYASITPIFEEIPGTMSSHLGFLLDVDLENTPSANLLDCITTAEPQKHSVHVVDYDALVELGRIDKLCPWVAESFSMLPFYNGTFMTDYLKKMKTTAH